MLTSRTNTTCSWCKEDFGSVEAVMEHEGRSCQTRRQLIREYEIKTRPRTWEFDQYVGFPRAVELGIWKSDTDPSRTWTVPGTVAITKDELGNQILAVEADGEKFTIVSYRDQWGTYYTLKSGRGSRQQVMAQEDGKRSFLRALIAGLQHMEQSMDFHTCDPEELEKQ